jgi:hypothetical protein
MKTKKKELTEYNKIKHEKAVLRKRDIFRTASDEINNLSEQDLKFVGIALYWAEGYKTDIARDVEFVNSDPDMIRLIMRWFRKACKVSEDKFKIRIQIHNPSNITNAVKFWSANTGVSAKQFTKPYIKISPTSKGMVGAIHPHGVCHIRIADTDLLNRIKGWINGMRGPIV